MSAVRALNYHMASYRRRIKGKNNPSAWGKAEGQKYRQVRRCGCAPVWDYLILCRRRLYGENWPQAGIRALITPRVTWPCIVAVRHSVTVPVPARAISWRPGRWSRPIPVARSVVRPVGPGVAPLAVPVRTPVSIALIIVTVARSRLDVEFEGTLSH